MKFIRRQRSEESDIRKEAFDVYREMLEFYATYLLPCTCTQAVLEELTNAANWSAVPDEFKVGYLLRVLVQTVIGHIRQCTEIPNSARFSSDSDVLAVAEGLPTKERLVYFLRETLNCRTRDTSLMLDVSDAHVEELFGSARERVERYHQDPGVKGASAYWQYFRWRFGDGGHC